MIDHPSFIRNKYLRWYEALIDHALSRAAPPQGEQHHIIPRSLRTGDNSVVKLTYREHFICHWLLTKFTAGVAHRKMNHAFGMMATSGHHFDRRLTSWQYKRAKAATSAAMVGNKRTLGRKRPAEECAKISKAKMGNQATLGYRHTPESQIKMSAAQRGNQKFLGKKHSAATKQKMSAAARQRPRNPDGTLAARVHP